MFFKEDVKSGRKENLFEEKKKGEERRKECEKEGGPLHNPSPCVPLHPAPPLLFPPPFLILPLALFPRTSHSSSSIKTA